MKKTVGRAADERLLQWLAMREAGKSVASIGRSSGVSGPVVAVQTNKVRDADQLESAEDLTGWYW